MVKSAVSRQVEPGAERQVVLQVSNLFGFDLRPSRIFFWYGGDREASQRIVSLDRAPRVLRRPQPRHYLHVGPARVSYLGNPVVTLGASVGSWYRQLRTLKRGHTRP
jgi:hypothetical protein